MGPGDLSQILCGIELPRDENLIVGAETSDDAGVYRLNEDTALIQTVDFFTPIVDDPFSFGQITAANALSDVYAMGGKPLLAMNILACPIKSMEKEVFRRIIQGGLDKIQEAGALLVGGHSIEDQELKYGLSVTGLVHPKRVLLNAGARPGDVLFLTKPLGTGILATAIKGGLAGTEVEDRIIQVMITLNKLAAEAVASVRSQQGMEDEVHACTDITGFGLLGHLHEMAEASGVSARLYKERIPLLDQAVGFVQMGIIPGGAHANRQYYRQWLLGCSEEPSDLEILIADPQTSGGLLIAATPKAAELIHRTMLECGYSLPCAIIGEIVDGDRGIVELI